MARTDPHCRIGKVKLKGGAELKIFEGQRDRYVKKILADFHTASTDMAKCFEGCMDGFAIVAWNRDGAFLSMFRTGKAATVGVNNLPEYVSGALRRDIAEEDVRKMLRGEQ